MLLFIQNNCNCDGFLSFWLWPLIAAFILGALLGWLLSRLCCCKKDCEKCGGAAVIDDSVKDDLTKVEGIGPKIKDLLNADGIWSFKQLSEAATSRLQKILDDAGPRYRVHNPKTWAEQAKMAHEGKWDELHKWQDELKGGL
jgi:hypothetical protein